MRNEWRYVRGRTKTTYLKSTPMSVWKSSSVRKRKVDIFFYIGSCRGCAAARETDSNEVVPWEYVPRK